MYRRPRNRVARDMAERYITRRLVRTLTRNGVAHDFAERLITRRLVRTLMIGYEYLSGLANRPRCWLLGHEGPVRRGYILCGYCGQKVRTAHA
jgi:hypothetical protein